MLQEPWNFPAPQAVIKGRNQGSWAKWKYSVSTLLLAHQPLTLIKLLSVLYLFSVCVKWR